MIRMEAVVVVPDRTATTSPRAGSGGIVPEVMTTPTRTVVAAATGSVPATGPVVTMIPMEVVETESVPATGPRASHGTMGPATTIPTGAVAPGSMTATGLRASHRGMVPVTPTPTAVEPSRTAATGPRANNAPRVMVPAIMIPTAVVEPGSMTTTGPRASNGAIVPVTTIPTAAVALGRTTATGPRATHGNMVPATPIPTAAAVPILVTTTAASRPAPATATGLGAVTVKVAPTVDKIGSTRASVSQHRRPGIIWYVQLETACAVLEKL
jgi:hypothetical protein